MFSGKLCLISNVLIFSNRRRYSLTKYSFECRPGPHQFVKQLLSAKRRFVPQEMAAAGCTSSSNTNRLSKQRSPYLLQHATNPVDWYPWGQEAFDKAKREDKLIFLSVGYSTCHWCHVMEKESFESVEIAKIMNEHFVNIKVDREERPDIDKIYMSFVQATAGGGGWPMSVWLTPDLCPIYGGTYFPPEDRYFGRPGFRGILMNLAGKWNDNRRLLKDSGSQIIRALQESCNISSSEVFSRLSIPGPVSWEKCYLQLSKSYEPQYGGFSEAPKFPQPVNLDFLFHFYSRNPNSQEGKNALSMCLYTLKMMAKGGIHDHVSQGFARYSTDKRWHVPHFEKMLYDQAQLVVSYSNAYVISKEKFYADIVEDILTYVDRDLGDKSGGFYSAEDADSYPEHETKDKREGAFCVWTFDEIQSILSKNVNEESVTLADVFCFHYDVKPSGNVDPQQDHQNELRNQNVLIVGGSEVKTAEKFNLSVDVVSAALKEGREMLYDARQKRPRPHLDNKMITAWNGLMISGFCKAGQALCEVKYLERAVDAANFVEKYLYDSSQQTLLRSCYCNNEGDIAQISPPIAGFLDDYAFLIRGLIDLYESSFESKWLEWAESLQKKQEELFWDEETGGYFTSSATDSSVLIRIKEDQDGAEPSGNSVSALNLLRLSEYLNEPQMKDKAAKLLKAFSMRLEKIPITLPAMTSALLIYHDSPTQIIVTGTKTDKDTNALLSVIYSNYVAGRVLALKDGQEESILYKRSEVISQMKPVGGKATAYVCRHHTCSLPVNTPDALLNLIQNKQ